MVDVIIYSILFAIASLLTLVALRLRATHSRHYNDFWRLWGEPPRMLFWAAAGTTIGRLIINLTLFLWPNPIAIGPWSVGAPILAFLVILLAAVISWLATRYKVIQPQNEPPAVGSSHPARTGSTIPTSRQSNRWAEEDWG